MNKIIQKWPRHIVLGGDDRTGGLEQNAYELEMLCNFIKEHDIQTYVEIGIAAGLLLKFMQQEMSLTVNGITLEYRDSHRGLPVIYGLSQDAEIVKNAPIADLYFIDGDHSYEAVKADYNNFKNKCKYMAFHDLLGERDCEGVAQLWSEIKDQYQHWEFIDSNYSIASGIGIIKLKQLNNDI